MKNKKNILCKDIMLVICIIAITCFGGCRASNDKVNELINNRGHKYKESYVKTPNKSIVETWIYASELSAEEKKECDDYVRQYYPNVKKIRGATLHYNCHSYAWYSRSKDNKHWINNPSMYWIDKSYKKYASSNGGIPKSVQVDSKVVYWDGTEPIHSGIVYSSTMIQSKWGMCGLYRHLPKDCPYSQSDNTYKLTFYK